MKKIALLAIDGSSIPNIAGALHLFDIANVLWNIENPGAGPVFTCSVVSPERICESLCDGLKFELSNTIDPFCPVDAVVTTGFLYRDLDHLIEKVEGAKKAVDWIQRQYYQGAVIGASCSGTMLLAESKLLNGKPATTSWWLGNLFRTRYPGVKLNTGRLLVEDGRLISSGAITSYLNLVLFLIEKFAGKNLALSCSKMMLIDINKHFQAPYSVLQAVSDHSDNAVTKAQYWINEHFQKKFNSNELADHIAVSHRTLIRKFKAATGDTPIKYLQKVRVEAAKRLLETTDNNLETIMERVGYSDPSSFHLLFKRLTQLTPYEYRHQFSIAHRNN